VRATLSQAQALGAGLPPLLVAAERIAATVAQGVHGRRRVGQGDSFWQFRALLPGEPASRVDWRRSAMAERGHFVRQTEWEAAQTVALWCAGGAGMHWRSGDGLPEKRERGKLLLLGLAALLLRGGERVRLLRSPPVDVAGQVGLSRLGAELMGDGVDDTLPPVAAVPRYGCVVLIGDWLEPLEEIRPKLAGLAGRGASGHVLQVLDPAEIDLPYAGRVRFRAAVPEGPRALIGRTESVREAYAARLAEQQAGLVGLCQAAGLSFSSHRTDHSASSALLSLYMALSPPHGPQ
jgi:uncharacterized protein (DUF58 family)